MTAQSLAPPLTNRLVDRYLMFGLAGLLAFLVLSVGLAWRGALTEFVSITVVLPLLLLLIGAYVLRRMLRLSEAIEQQLQHLGAASASLESPLLPLVETGPAAAGWNALLERLRDQQAFAALESRLATALAPLEERRWEAVGHHLADGVAVCDSNLSIVLANNALAAMLGAESPSRLAGSSLSNLLATTLTGERPDLVEQLASGSGKFSCDFLKSTQLSSGVLRVSRLPLQGEAFPAGGTLWTVRDVTQQRLAEESRTQFVYAATHELRTPLANIKAYAETLAAQDGIDEEKQKSFYNIINAEATRLARFVDELLNVSQMESGSLGIVRHEMDLERSLLEVVEHIQPQIEQKRIHFETHFPAKLPKLKADKGKLAAALTNLLGNALKYTPEEGRVQLLVEAEAAHVHIHVEDTGYGIAPELLPRLCEKFFRSDDARVQAVSGSGLGLAYTQEVARLHGGRLSIRSELNKGSRFTLTLPLN